RTVAVLRRFLQLSLDTGRVPSLLGRQFFRAKVTSYRMTTFEDAVIFVHDVEKCLARLDELSRMLIARVVLQEYTHDEVASMLRVCRKTIHRQLLEALDHMSEILLESGLLRPISSPTNCCQEGRNDENLVTRCEERK
ncbi:MAG TPA: sigma factor-like helix-turn-helix DNA-binding protein, partial [Terriglobales bacterium]